MDWRRQTGRAHYGCVLQRMELQFKIATRHGQQLAARQAARPRKVFLQQSVHRALYRSRERGGVVWPAIASQAKPRTRASRVASHSKPSKQNIIATRRGRKRQSILLRLLQIHLIAQRRQRIELSFISAVTVFANSHAPVRRQTRRVGASCYKSSLMYTRSQLLRS